MKVNFKRFTLLIIAVIMATLVLSANVFAAEATVVIDLSKSGKVVLSVTDGVKYYSLNGGTPVEYTGIIAFTGEAPSGTNIQVAGGQHDIELIDATIETNSGAAVDIVGVGTGVNMRITGTNTVRSGSGYAGIDAISGTFILITADSTGTIYAYGGLKSAGIGGGPTDSSGNITIAGGTIYAYGGNHGAGIGGGREGGGTIKLEGGVIYAQGGNGGGVAIGNGKANSVSTEVDILVPAGKTVEIKASEDDTTAVGTYTEGLTDITDTVATMTNFYCNIGVVVRDDIEVDGGNGDIAGDTIVLGIDHGDGTYSLFDDVIGWWFITGTEERFVDAGLYEVFGGEQIHTVYIPAQMVEGAQIRYGGGLDEDGKVSSAQGNGIRFVARVDRSSVDDTVVTAYGMAVTAESSSSRVLIPANKWQTLDQTIYTCAITNLATSNFNRNFTAWPYVDVTYSDGHQKRVFGTKSVTRSIYYVATGLLATSNNGVPSEDDRYGVGINSGLYEVLNAYVNMVGIRIGIDNNNNVTVREGSGAYSGEAFFDVESVDNADGSVTITITPLSGDFNNPVQIAEYWRDYIRINNNNSTAVQYIESSTIDENGALTFVFRRG